jgi:hypothetical protein
MANKLHAFGTKLLVQRAASPPDNWDLIGNVADITGPEETLEMLDATTHDSPNFYSEKLPGVIDGGTLTFECFVNHVTASDAGQIALRTKFTAREIGAFAVISPGGTLNGYAGGVTNAKVRLFSGYVSKMGASYPVRGGAMMSVEITVTSTVTLTLGAA